MSEGLNCPVPHPLPPLITVAHGGGGTAMHRLINEIFLQQFDNPVLREQGDAARIALKGMTLAFTTDAFVVRPLFFPGGDIGALSVYGTVNDLAMQGASPLCLSAAFVLEEGLPMETVERVAASMRRAADEAGVSIVTGDTKVVERSRGEELLITTAGIGLCRTPVSLSGNAIVPGDRILVSGDLGRHGIAVMSVREGLEFTYPIESDAAPLVAQVMALLDAGVELHALRDLTRGGLASAVNELAVAAGRSFLLREDRVPVCEEVRGACELLGLDPLYVANEGRFMAVVPESDAGQALEVLRGFHAEAALVGEVSADLTPRAVLESLIGAPRILDMLSGEQLPRIC